MENLNKLKKEEFITSNSIDMNSFKPDISINKDEVSITELYNNSNEHKGPLTEIENINNLIPELDKSIIELSDGLIKLYDLIEDLEENENGVYEGLDVDNIIKNIHLKISSINDELLIKEKEYKSKNLKKSK